MATTLVRDRIQEMVAAAVQRARQEGAIQLESMPDILVERPGNPDHGDFATSLPLRLARATRINPLKLAETLGAIRALR
ncbi:Arginine--tRNA ligase [Geodia barretti]|uniref:Arginine--tRNA ligase n=1 Tax=Geodia barretti TaxID=519541 RepID=A0AA35WR95_GEOBA|nr:Arginine--tRNA ligase [Geodia barretti]